MNIVTSYKFIRNDINSLLCQLNSTTDLCEASANLHKLVEQLIIKRSETIGLYDDYINGIFEEVSKND